MGQDRINQIVLLIEAEATERAQPGHLISLVRSMHTVLMEVMSKCIQIMANLKEQERQVKVSRKGVKNVNRD